ncbi:MAG: hypothetical protein WD768_20610 [Phycisphaeraceae bacterium]
MKKQKASITINHSGAVVVPADSALLSSLTIPVREFEPGGKYGVREVFTQDSLFEKRIDNRIIIRPGLVPRAAAVLNELGFNVTINDQRQWPYHLRGDADPFHTDVDPDLFHAIKANPGGQIIVPRLQTAETIADIARTFSNAAVLILTMRTHDARGLWRALPDHANEYIGLRAGKADRPARVVVGTLPAIKSYNPDGAEIIILVNAHEFTGRHAITQICQATKGPTRVYAIHNNSAGPAHRRGLIIEGLAGPVIYPEVHAHPEPPTPVYRLEPRTKPSVIAGNACEKKRDGIWLNDNRNDIVASVAIAAASGDIATLRRSGLLLDQDKYTLNDAGVTVLVENVEHGRQLLQRLPDWMLRSRHEDLVSSEPGEENPGRTVYFHQITTLGYVAGQGVNTDVLIDATGGTAHDGHRPFGPYDRLGATAAGNRISTSRAVILIGGIPVTSSSRNRIQPRHKDPHQTGQRKNRKKKQKGNALSVLPETAKERRYVTYT